MARTFRWYNKKRGNRRTGSPTLGSIGEAIFFAVFLLIGSIALTAMIFTLLIPEWRANHEFVEHQCRVVGKRLAQTEGEDGPLFRPEFQIEYTVNGVEYRTWTYKISNPYSSGRESKHAILTRFTVGENVPCWYDPLDPEQVVLVRGYSWWIYLLLLVPMVFIFIGAGGLIYTLLNWGKSAERRSAMTQRVQERDLFGTNGSAEKEYPTVPQRFDITSSPGTKLRYRLPIETSPGWALFGTLLTCVIWNGIVAVMLYYALRGHILGDPQWILTIFLIPFVLVGVFLIFFFFRQLLLTAGIGPTLLEISDHPLYPGMEYKIFLSQSGRLTMNILSLSLVCHEEATYQQGTNTRTETKEVFRQELYRRDNFEIPPGIPFETDCQVTVPADAMHSFKSTHNKIDWKLVVEGNIAGWPDFKRAFSVIVYPALERIAL
ncbi:MAG TPA: DUF3592 domain-containing protein [Thermoguttaceae bacterium]